MKKSWKSPGILFSHLCTNPVRGQQKHKKLPSMPLLFSVFEKSVVMWTPDSEVKNCPFCGRSFGMTRRRHHCRLCGGIMCDRCSHFLTHAYASKFKTLCFLANISKDFPRSGLPFFSETF